MVCRDSMLGPSYLIFQEVIEPCELAATFLLNYHCELMTKRNVAFNQPDYSVIDSTLEARGSKTIS